MKKKPQEVPQDVRDVLLNGNNQLPQGFIQQTASYPVMRPDMTGEMPAFQPPQEAKEQGEKKRPTETFYNPLDIVAEGPPEWIVPDLIGRGNIIQLFGPSNEGKTFIAFDLIFACLTGGLFAGLQAEKLKNIVYMTDEGTAGLGRRIQACRVARSVDDEDFKRFIITKKVPQLYHRTDIYHATDFIRDWKEKRGEPLDLLFIDTQHAATIGAKENDAGDAGVVLQNIKRLQEELTFDELKPTILLVHHATKDGGTSRGSSAYRGAWDTELKVDKGTLQVTKQKDAPRKKEIYFNLHSIEESCTVFWDKEKPKDKLSTTRKEIFNFFEKQNAKEITIKEAKEWTGATISTARRVLEKLYEEGKVDKDMKGKNCIYSLLE